MHPLAKEFIRTVADELRDNLRRGQIAKAIRKTVQYFGRTDLTLDQLWQQTTGRAKQYKTDPDWPNSPRAFKRYLLEREKEFRSEHGMGVMFYNDGSGLRAKVFNVDGSDPRIPFE